MKTKDRILETALRLFNEKGISNVSSKYISEEMGISYGNLCYHFPKKDDIILQLYLNMQERIDEQFKHIQEEVVSLEFMLGSLKILFEEFFRYKFIYLGITKVMRHFEHIKRHAQEQMESRRVILDDIAKYMIANGYMKTFKSEKQKDMLIHALLLVMNSWISDSEIFYIGDEKDKVDYYMKLFFNLIRPTLTKEGLEVYQQVYDAQDNQE